MKEEKFLDVLCLGKNDKNAIVQKWSDDFDCKNLDKIILNQALLKNRLNVNYDSVNDFLIRCGASEELLRRPISNKSSLRFEKENPGFYREKLYFVREDVFLTKRILQELGNPEKKIGPVIHVTGSNGKGSVVMFAESIFRENGYKVNKFTTPHVIRNNENIILNGEEISDEEYYRHVILVKEAYDAVMKDKNFTEEFEKMLEEDFRSKRIHNKELYRKPLFWSFNVPIMILSFLEHTADVNIIEVITGGLEDCTNIFTEGEILATAMVYTQSDIGSNDGVMLLPDENGKWVSNNKSIAYHKAMLSRSGRPMVTANQSPDVLEEIRRVAKENGAYTVEYGKDWFANIEKNGVFVFEGFGKKLKLALDPTEFAAEGNYQIINAATAIAAVFSQDKLKIDATKIQSAIGRPKTLIARLKVIDGGFYKEYFGDKCNVIAGCIKNDSSLESLKKILDGLEGDVYIVYTTGTPASKGKHRKFFKLLGNYDNIKRLTFYRCLEEGFKDMINEALETKTTFSTANYLAAALQRTRDELNPKKKNSVLILCNVIRKFDKHIILLGGL